MPSIADHPLRFDLVNELHARPFPEVKVPSHVAFLAIMEPTEPQSRDRTRDLAHLQDLLRRNGGVMPDADASHFAGEMGRYGLKWESHTEFVTYSVFGKGVSSRPFDPVEVEVFPQDWLEAAPGKRLCSVLVRVETMPESEAEILARAEEWFVPESLAMARVVDGAAVIAGDFRIDPAGHMRFAIFVRPGTGPRRVGRIVQRLCEIETYRAMSMLGLMASRSLNAELNRIDPRLSELVRRLDADQDSPETVLHELLTIASELERLAVQNSFRFGATAAYEAIVTQRVEVLREERLSGRQIFAEFLMRRYDPAMRTVKSAETRLKSMTERAERAAELLRTRVDVERSAQNQSLLESMDRRADLQLRLQHTVEGLSVVAISYYAVSLAAYIGYPFAASAGLSKEVLMLLLTPAVILGVWLMIRRIRHHVG